MTRQKALEILEILKPAHSKKVQGYIEEIKDAIECDDWEDDYDDEEDC